MSDSAGGPVASPSPSVSEAGALARWLAPTSQSRVERIGCAEIDDRPWPRRRDDDDSLYALRDSVEQRGLIEPLLLRPSAGARLEVVLGARRLLVARGLGLATVPAIVRELTDSEAALLAAWSVLPSLARHAANEIASHLSDAGVGDGEIATLLAAGHPGESRRPGSGLPATFSLAGPLRFATLATPVSRLLVALGDTRSMALLTLNRTDPRHLELLAS